MLAVVSSTGSRSRNGRPRRREAMKRKRAGITPFDDLTNLEAVRRHLTMARTHSELVALNDAVEQRFHSDRRRIVMSDEDWNAYTGLLQQKLLDVGADH